jgi:hypothetical protein
MPNNRCQTEGGRKMAVRRFWSVKYERQAGERFDVLHLNLKVPRATVPEETSSHFKTAGKELLLGGQSFIGVVAAWLSRLGNKWAPADGTGLDLVKKER